MIEFLDERFELSNVSLRELPMLGEVKNEGSDTPAMEPIEEAFAFR
jgi:hypothetical protein